MALIKTYEIEELNFEKLDNEIAASNSLNGYEGLLYSNGVLQVHAAELIDENELDLLVSNHSTTPSFGEQGKLIAEKAKLAFDEIASEFVGENIELGITQAGKTRLIQDALREVIFYGKEGSLYAAEAAVNEIEITPEMAPFITEARMQEFLTRLWAKYAEL